MNMKIKNNQFLVIFCALFFLINPLLVWANNPAVLLKSIADRMIFELKQHQATLKSNPSFVYGLAYRLVVPHADILEMSRRVLPPAIWNRASSSQKLAFQRGFTSLLVRTYASALASYRDQTVRFFPVRSGLGAQILQVDSEILSETQSIRVSYKLIARGSQWKLFDLSVEGVSLINSFRSQFADILNSGDMNYLIQRLNQHNGRRGD